MNIMKLKRFFSIITSTILLAHFSSSIQGNNVKAETDSLNTTILFGDANLDGGITTNDAVCISDYLLGKTQVTQAQFTAMDYNQDMVIDQYDAQRIMHDAIYGYSYNYTNSLYTVPDNSSRTYYKHTCNTGTSSTYSSYILSAATNTINNSLADIDDSFIETNNRAIDQPDNENTSCVKLIMKSYDNHEWEGSGFIIDDGIIATAAHCLYDQTYGFMKSVEIRFYNANCSDVLAIAFAHNIHVPANYITTPSTIRDNYDYGLIYFDPEDDVIYYDDYYYIGNDKVNIGFMSNEFMYTDSYVTTSGFTSDSTHIDRRYFSTDVILPLNDSPYRFASDAYAYFGQSGGMTYFKPYNNYKSTVGIVTHTTYPGTLGIRLNTTLMRFYKQNNYL
jgi:V8-like Glu-specific endopeptidase